MSLNFWDTVRGHQFADSLILNIPEISRNLRKLNKEKNQIVEQYVFHEAKNEIEKMIEKGFHVDHMETVNNYVLVIYSK